MHFNFPSNIKVCKYKSVQTLFDKWQHIFCVQTQNKAALSEVEQEVLAILCYGRLSLYRRIRSCRTTKQTHIKKPFTPQSSTALSANREFQDMAINRLFVPDKVKSNDSYAPRGTIKARHSGFVQWWKDKVVLGMSQWPEHEGTWDTILPS